MPNATVTAEEIADLKQNIDDFFIMMNGIFISLMQCGFGCLELGAVRTKNAVNILMKNLLDLVLCGFAYYLIGYPLAYGEGNAFAGSTYWAAADLPLSCYVNWFFQFIFAATSATIVSGAVAERCNFVAYLVYSVLISGIVYPIATHWAWSPNGWLNTFGYHDFSGCGVVHALAGTCAFTAAALLGPRKGRFDEKGRPQNIGGHSMPIMGVGALLLFTGFLAFNGGALSHISQKGDGILVAKSMINTIIAGVGGGLVSLVLCRFRFFNESPWPFSFILNGTLAGMASSCAAPQEYAFWAMYVIGTVSGLLYLGFHHLVLYFKIDDPLDASALHLSGGIWGMIAEGIFSSKGLIYGATHESGMRMLADIVGLLAIMCWSAAWSLFMFGGLKCLHLLRVSEQHELEGLDMAEHGEEAYPVNAWKGFGVGTNGTVMIEESLYPLKKDNYDQALKSEPLHVWYM